MKNHLTINSQDQLKQSLEKEYELICFVDLADISHSPGKIYELLKKYNRIYFKQNQRLVFYTNQPIPENLLSHIKQACLHIDVSASFILLCSSIDHSSAIKKIFGLDDFPKNLIVEIDSLPLTNDFYIPDSICPLPWMHIATTNQGHIQPCCVNSETIGHVEKNTFAQVFDSPPMKKLRKDLLQGQKPKSCDHCWNTESYSGLSHRQRLLKKYKTDFLTQWILDPKLRSIDLKAGNTCNFKCRICSPVASSQIVDEQLKFSSDAKQIISLKQLAKQGKWFDSEHLDIIGNIIESAPSLLVIDFYGGEPFLLKSFNSLLEKLIDTGYASQIMIHVNSNASIFPEHLITNLSHFNQVNICLSIDDLGHRFEYQRGGVWATIVNNIKKYKLLDAIKFKLSIYPVINIQNVYYIDELIAWAAQHDLQIDVEYLHSPSWLSITNLTSQAKELIIAKFADHNHPLIQSIITKIKMSTGSDGQDFCNQMIKLDSQRNQKFSDHHREIALAMGYNK
jgi:sulfatase maturation enzyme AslB (radical SAM superfamily)